MEQILESLSPGIKALQPYEAGRPMEEVAAERGLKSIIKLASNENPIGPSEAAMRAAQNALYQISRYPDAGQLKLREALATKLGVNREEICCGNGSNELLELVARCFCRTGDSIVFSDLSFVVYGMLASSLGLEAKVAPAKNWAHDLEAMLALIDGTTRVVYVANPNNPTGTYAPENELIEFLKRVPEDVIVVLDEAYFEYAEAADYPDGVALRRFHEATLVCRTFSKAYGLAGLRVGYSVGPAALTDYLHRVRAPFNVSIAAQAAAIAALGDDAHLERVVELNRSERKRLREACLSG